MKNKKPKEKIQLFESFGDIDLAQLGKYFFLTCLSSMVLLGAIGILPDATLFESWIVLLIWVITIFYVAREVIFKMSPLYALPTLVLLVALISKRADLILDSTIVFIGALIIVVLDQQGLVYNFIEWLASKILKKDLSKMRRSKSNNVWDRLSMRIK